MVDTQSGLLAITIQKHILSSSDDMSLSLWILPFCVKKLHPTVHIKELLTVIVKGVYGTPVKCSVI